VQFGVAGGPAQFDNNNDVSSVPLRHRAPAHLYDDVVPVIDDSMLLAGRGRIPTVWMMSARRRPVVTEEKKRVRSLFRTSSSDTDCILAFSLGLSVPTLRQFCRLGSTI